MVASTEPKSKVDITEGYVPCGDDVIDEPIKSAVRDHYDELSNGARTAYRDANIKEKLNATCWDWGMSPDPEIQGRSRNLKTKLFIRSLARVVLQGNPEESEFKSFPTFDNYWREVDEKLKLEIDDFTRRHDGIIVPHHTVFHGNSENVYEPLAEIEQFRIYGRFLIRDGISYHATYLAQHKSLPVNE
jgi:hypothetical protein